MPPASPKPKRLRPKSKRRRHRQRSRRLPQPRSRQKCLSPRPQPPPPEIKSGDSAASVSASRDSDGLRLSFSFSAATPAALFRRADTVWLLFDSKKPIDVEPIRSQGGAVIADVSVMPLEKGQAVRIRLNRPQMPSLTGDDQPGGANWTVTFADAMQTPTQPLVAIRNIADPAHANVAVPLSKAGRAASACRSGRGRHPHGGHGDGAGSRLHQAAGFCRDVAAGIDPRRGDSSELR